MRGLTSERYPTFFNAGTRKAKLYSLSSKTQSLHSQQVTQRIAKAITYFYRYFKSPTSSLLLTFAIPSLRRSDQRVR